MTYAQFRRVLDHVYARAEKTKNYAEIDELLQCSRVTDDGVIVDLDARNPNRPI